MSSTDGTCTETSSTGARGQRSRSAREVSVPSARAWPLAAHGCASRARRGVSASCGFGASCGLGVLRVRRSSCIGRGHSAAARCRVGEGMSCAVCSRVPWCVPCSSRPPCSSRLGAGSVRDLFRGRHACMHAWGGEPVRAVGAAGEFRRAAVRWLVGGRRSVRDGRYAVSSAPATRHRALYSCMIR